MTAAQQAAIVEGVLKAAGLIVSVDNIRATHMLRAGGQAPEAAGAEMSVTVHGVRPGGEWERTLISIARGKQ